MTKTLKTLAVSALAMIASTAASAEVYTFNFSGTGLFFW